MTHPLDQLAPYVDGSLTGPERLVVERHLASCAQCRSEVAIATEARAALRSMPDVEVPTDLGVPALEAMEAGEAHDPGPRWVRAMPFVAAAAVVALLAIIILPALGGGDSASDSTGVQALPAAPDARDLRLEVVSTDFDATSLQSEAQASAARFADTTSEPQENAAEASSPTGAAKTEGAARSAEALRCLRTAFEGFPGDPVRLVEASFEGTPAYLAFVLEGPGADQPADQMTVWVAARDDCSIVSLTSIRL